VSAVASGNTGDTHRAALVDDRRHRRRPASMRSAGLVEQWHPDALVVGVPFHPDGAAHDNTERARRFGRQLHGRFHLPCTRWTNATPRRRRRPRPRSDVECGVGGEHPRTVS
jgi:RNase H-fold protein (predicted Holliday junction resolvase)